MLQIFTFLSNIIYHLRENKLNNFAPKKSLGQHFLHDKNIAKKIVELLNPPAGSLVLEIGSGTGVLTDFLLKLDINLVSVEIDERSVTFLKEKYADKLNKNFFIYDKDFLKLNLNEISEKFEKKIYVIGNIPYYITTPILFHLYEYSASIVKSVIMVQKEIGQRLRAKERTKEYGILTLGLQLYGKIGKLYDVPASCFLPQPKVKSCFFEINYYAENEGLVPIDLRKKVHELVRFAFQQRRKKLSNSLKSYFALKNIQLESKTGKITEYFNKRPEELLIEDYLFLYYYFNSGSK